ncbi:hypothetical protein ElyMa_002364700 [Elysia marginata]|uniref:Uncharacterized protein n=1 Tax=Elysia marginata TaxID=1093978 RepID=A0AAV4GBM1_9GAST|nr:hypothetical protein ElyMa_002364700 [Elysia marginata]
MVDCHKQQETHRSSRAQTRLFSSHAFLALSPVSPAKTHVGAERSSEPLCKALDETVTLAWPCTEQVSLGLLPLPGSGTRGWARKRPGKS